MKFDDISALLETYEITEFEDKLYVTAVANNTGCGYSILTEIIIDLYQDKPELFKEEYGYPLYYEQDGEIIYNYETLFIDIFARINKRDIKKLSHEENNYAYLFTMVGVSLYDTDIRFDDMPMYLSEIIDEDTETAAFKRDISVKKHKEYMGEKDFDFACIALFG